MSDDGGLLDESAEELLEEAPCGYLATRPDGTILKVNRTFEAWTGHARGDLVGARRFQELLSVGGRIYHETHVAPLLQMQGAVREIAVEIVRADGSRLPALLNAVLHRDAEGRPRVIRTTVFDATDRRRYEAELLRVQRREQEIAQQLQRSLLAGVPPEDPRLDLATAYRPGVSGLEVGGDFHDAFWVDGGQGVGLVVGDVVGRGIEAAATMGQLRSAVRALAATGLRPAALLTALDGYARRHQVGQMATLVLAWVDLASRELRYACAGHPPPAVLAPGAEPEYAWDGRSLPLDAAAGAARERGEAVATLAPGSTLVLYTDGLVERRRRPLRETMGQLLEVAAAAPAGAAGLVEALVRGLYDPEHHDDVCVLAARVD